MSGRAVARRNRDRPNCRSSTTPRSAPSPPGPKHAGRCLRRRSRTETAGQTGAKADFRNTCLREDVEARLEGAAVRLRSRKPGSSSAWPIAPAAAPMQCSSNGRASIRNTNPTNISATSGALSRTPIPSPRRRLFDEVFRRFPGWKKPSERGADYAGPAEDDDWDSEPDDETKTDRFDEEALPLCPEPRPAEPYPLEALGSLQGVVEGIAKAVGCDPGLAAQSVLMTASLATVGIANIDLPKIGDVWAAVVLRDDRPLQRTKVVGRSAGDPRREGSGRRARRRAQATGEAAQGRGPHLCRGGKSNPEGQKARSERQGGRS